MPIDKSVTEYLRFQFQHGLAILFSGSGFSYGSKDLDGKPLPTGPQLAEELWRLVYPGEPFDSENTLQDLFQAAHLRHRQELDAILRRRFSIRPESLPDHVKTWFSVPWRRIYTLNVDDLEQAASRRFELARPFQSISGLGKHATPSRAIRAPNALEVIHLNGLAMDGADGVTFSVSQYSQRLVAQEPWYARLAVDILAHAVVFVGTPLDEAIFWQHIESRGARGPRGLSELRPRSFLVTPSLRRARQDLLRTFNVEWIRATGEEFAREVLENLTGTWSQGITALGVAAAAPSNETIHDVATIAAPTGAKRSSLFLLGAEPEWEDLHAGLAIKRKVDDQLFGTATASLRAVRAKANKGEPQTILVTGTAGTGKSTSLMRLALALSAGGSSVKWIDREDELGPRQITSISKSLVDQPILIIDDADRYGKELVSIVEDCSPYYSLIIIGMRSSRAERFVNTASDHKIPLTEVSLPFLADEDIGGLLDVLEADGKLGKLTGKDRRYQEKIFRDVCGRQLLVAMIEATSYSTFEEKVFDEWRDLDDFGREAYGLVAVATSFKHSLTREDILLASGNQTNAALNGINALHSRNLLIPAAGGRLRTRHRIIAEKLIDRLQGEGNTLARLIAKLTFVAATQVDPTLSRTSRPWRFLKALINHSALLRMIGSEGAREVYDEVQTALSWDYHYWLQRGSAEVEEGDIRLAQNYLEQARALNPEDPYVQTEYAYMLFKRAVSDPTAAKAQNFVDEAVDILLNQIAVRGKQDNYPFHVLGSQTIAWVRRGTMSTEDRKSLLRTSLKKLEAGTRLHPRHEDLATLEKDVRKELLRVEAGIA